MGSTVAKIVPLWWAEDHLKMVDQRVLPRSFSVLDLQTWQEVETAIKDMAVRGAPAIGIAAAYGLALAARQGEFEAAVQGLAQSRPTAVNLFWAINRVRALPDHSFECVIREAQIIEAEDLACNQEIGRRGAELLQPGSTVVTICNTGGLATGGHGTALGVVRTGYREGKVSFVYSCETRPRLQGLRLTAWELAQEGIPFASIAEGVAASLMKEAKIDAVIVGADRIAANGDTANKVGTYMLAVLARHHQVPFYVAAPTSTLDPATPGGDEIPIEERASSELTYLEGIAVAPEGCPVFNPAFDVTPGELIDAIITEQGTYQRPYNFR